ncbi:META domain-containing protein, partial [Verminephrobacter eiseniae]|nr:META domain-containing protein [Verminephrobacter eiseniae]
VGLRWPSKRIAALHRLPIRSVLAARCALRYAPMAARSLRHLIRDATLAGPGNSGGQANSPPCRPTAAGSTA